MPTIGYQDLQYPTERFYFNRLHPLLSGLTKAYGKFVERAQQKEKEFFRLLSHSLKITDAAAMRRVIERINEDLNLDFRVHVFVTSFPHAEVMAMPRYFVDEVARQEPILIVSQHFLNELKPDEQICIIGHEIGHFLYGHANIPARAILESQFQMKDIGSLKSDVMKWMICSEISCDLLGFVAGGRKVKTFVDGMLKLTTGLNDVGMALLDDPSGVHELARKQYEDLARSDRPGELSTHPLTLLRARLIEEIAGTSLIRFYNQPVEPDELRAFAEEYNQTLDRLVGEVYPAIPVNGQLELDDLIYELGVAVILADGKLDPEELKSLSRFSTRERDLAQTLQAVKERLRRIGLPQTLQEIVDSSTKKARAWKMSAQSITDLARELLVIAASDGDLDKREFDVILNFTTRFGLREPELRGMIAQLGIEA